jgi:hypothetical protein
LTGEKMKKFTLREEVLTKEEEDGEGFIKVIIIDDDNEYIYRLNKQVAECVRLFKDKQLTVLDLVLKIKEISDSSDEEITTFANDIITKFQELKIIQET